MCNRRLRVHKVDTSSDDDSETEVLHIHMTQPADNVPDDKWTIRCRVENKQIKFKIDTGVHCNTLTLSDYQKIQHKGELKRSTKLLRTYSNHQIKPVAVADLSLEHNSNLATTSFQIVDIDQENVLSGNTAEALQLISRLASVGTPSAAEEDQVPEGLHEFPDLTQTTGALPGTYTIKLEPSANGEVERAVQTVKHLWRKAADKQLALLDYRTTPLEGNNLSPAQLLTGRRPRNKLPSLRELLTPTAYNRQDVMQRLNQQKANQKFYHDSKSASDLPPLRPGDQVRMAPHPGSKMWNPAIVVKHHDSPRPYIVESSGQEYRRNQRHLRRSTEAENTTEHCSDLAADDNTPHLNSALSSSPPTELCDRPSSQQQEPATTTSAETSEPDEPYTTRSGRAVRCPEILDL